MEADARLIRSISFEQRGRLVEYRLERDGEGFVVQRRMVLADDSQINLVVPFRRLERLSEFIRAEPIAEKRTQLFDLVAAAVTRGAKQGEFGQPAPSRTLPAESLARSSRRALEAQSVGDLAGLLRSVADSVGARSYWLTLVGHLQEGRPSVFILPGGDLKLVQEYVERGWYFVDPMLVALRGARVPVVGSRLKRESTGQQALYAAAQRCSEDVEVGMGTPAHSHWLGVEYGALILREGGDVVESEQRITEWGAVLQGVAAHTCDWWMRELVRRQAATIGVTPREAAALMLQGEGLSARAAAERLGLSEVSVQQSVRRAKAKMKARTIDEACARLSEAQAFGMAVHPS